VMILVDGLIIDRVAVSVAVSSLIMWTRVRDHRRRDSSLPRKVKVPGRIHIHLRSVQVRASSAATGCDAAAAIRPIVGAPRATKQRDCPARKAKRITTNTTGDHRRSRLER
jgi:hypothetical protein